MANYFAVLFHNAGHPRRNPAALLHVGLPAPAEGAGEAQPQPALAREGGRAQQAGPHHRTCLCYPVPEHLRVRDRHQPALGPGDQCDIQLPGVAQEARHHQVAVSGPNQEVRATLCVVQERAPRRHPGPAHPHAQGRRTSGQGGGAREEVLICFHLVW